MSTARCPDPVPIPDLLDYWLDPLPDDEGDAVEEHLLGCSGCSGTLAELVALGRATRRVVERGGLRVIVGESVVERLAGLGLRLRQYRVPAGGRVDCTVTDQDDIMIARLAAPDTLAQRVDLVICDEAGREGARLADIPAGGAGADVVFIEPIAALRRLEATVIRVRLVGVDENEERLLGEYAFHHTPSSPG